MIPYVEIPSIPIWGAVSIEPFGVLIAVGCLVGYVLGRRHGQRLGLEVDAFAPLAFSILIPGFLLSYWSTIVLYYSDHLATLLYQPYRLSPMFSFGGFLGAALGGTVYLHLRRLPRRWAHVDAVMVGLLVGWFFGRLGCTIAHDHPGIRTDIFLAVQFPDGPRHDLGFYEWLLTIALIAVVFPLRKRPLPDGAITGTICIGYAPVRFLLDFLRIEEVYYLGLTPGQHGSILLLLLGIAILATRRSPVVAPSRR